MADNRLYLAIGEETTRGAAQTTTVGFVPVLSGRLPSVEFEEGGLEEFRGEPFGAGIHSWQRRRRGWKATLEIPFYTEAGSMPSMVGTLLKHLFGGMGSAQRGGSTAYSHILYPSAKMYDEGGLLYQKALTLNYTLNEGNSLANYPYVGGRVVSIGLEQSPAEPLKLTVELTGQYRGAPTTALPEPTFPAEPLRCDHRGFSLYTGGVVRYGVAPDFTDINPDASAIPIKPDRVSITIDSGKEDIMRLSGLDYPDRTRVGVFNIEVEITLDWQDPQSGFSTVDELNSWLSGTATTSMLFIWDTGTEAGTGYNHKLVVDLPRLVRTGGEPEYHLDKEPTITLRYRALYESTTGYAIAMLLQNSAQSL